VVRKTCKAEDAMDVLAMALDSSFGDSKAEGLSLIHDRGSQFTAWKFKEMVSNASVTNVAVRGMPSTKLWMSRKISSD